jgi:hypothetical protein
MSGTGAVQGLGLAHVEQDDLYETLLVLYNGAESRYYAIIPQVRQALFGLRGFPFATEETHGHAVVPLVVTPD